MSRDGRGGDREVAPRVGVREVRRRSRGRRLLAPGTLHRLRRGRRVLGTRGDGRGRAGIAEEEVPASAAEKLSDTVARFVGRRWRSGAGSRGGWLSCSASTDRTAPRRARTCSRLATVRRTHRAARPGRARLRGPAVGGPRAPRFHRPSAGLESRSADLRPRVWHGPRSWIAGPAGERGGVAVTSLFLEPARRRDDGVPAARDGARPPPSPSGARSAIARRGSRSTPSRPSGCSSIEGCFAATGTVSSPRVHRGPGRARDAPYADPGALGRPRARGPALLQDASVLGKTFRRTPRTLTGRDENAVRGSLRARPSGVPRIQSDERSPERDSSDSSSPDQGRVRDVVAGDVRRRLAIGDAEERGGDETRS